MNSPTQSAPAAPAAAPSSSAPTNVQAGGEKQKAPGGPQQSARNERGQFVSATAPPERGETSATPPPKPKLKIKDQEFDEDSAWAEIQRGRQASKLLTEAQRRARAAEERERQLEERRARAKEDIGHLFEGLDLSPDQERDLLSKYLYSRHIEPHQMTEEQRRIRELEQKLKAKEDAESKEKQRLEEERKKQVKLEKARELEGELMQLASSGAIPGFDPKNPSAPASALAMRRFAERLLILEEAGLSPAPELVAQKVKEDISRDVLDFVSATAIDQRKSLWGDKAFAEEEERWRKHFVAKLRQAPWQQQARETAPAPPGAPQKKMTPQEWLEWRRKH